MMLSLQVSIIKTIILEEDLEFNVPASAVLHLEPLESFHNKLLELLNKLNKKKDFKVETSSIG